MLKVWAALGVASPRAEVAGRAQLVFRTPRLARSQGHQGQARSQGHQGQALGGQGHLYTTSVAKESALAPWNLGI